METLSLILRWTTQGVYVVLGVATVIGWRRRRSAPAGWLAATFGTLAVVVLAGAALPSEPEAGWHRALAKLLIALLASFPYLLYRFATSFAPVRRSLNVAAASATGAVIAITFALPRFPRPGEPRPVLFQVFLVLFLAQWTALSVPVAVRLWRAGRGQPSISRKRMQLLGAGAATLAVALLLSGTSGGREVTVRSVVVQLVSLASAPLFFLGFAPPSALRTVWRARDEAAMREAQLGLLSALTPRSVAAAVLPAVAGLLGGRGAVLFDPAGRVLGSTGLEQARIDAVAREARDVHAIRAPFEIRPGVLGVRLRGGFLAVEASPYSPFFARAELDLLSEASLFTDLALERAELFDREREARQEVERANAELESFVYSASHDLRSPLITMLSYLDFIRSDGADRLDPEQRRFLDRMDANGRYMNDLIGDLLELSRIGRMQTETESVPLDGVIGEVADAVRVAHPEASVVTSPLPAVRMNAVRARQLLTNLVENAAVHGGRPDIRIAVSAGPGGPGMAEIVVADDGAGIPEEYRDRVFGVFERLDPRGSSSRDGTGIGLAICKKIVEQSHGQIWIADVEAGAEFHIMLPAAAGDRTREAVQVV